VFYCIGMCYSTEWLKVLSSRARSGSFVSSFERYSVSPHSSTCGMFETSLRQLRYYKVYNALVSMNHIALNFSPSSIPKTTTYIIEEHSLGKEVFHICYRIVLHMSVVRIMAWEKYLATLSINQTFLCSGLLHSQKATDLSRNGLAIIGKKGWYAYVGYGVFGGVSLMRLVLAQLDSSSLSCSAGDCKVIHG